jgi:ElaB/YqjD/DUF883 family membrane-anchored ribosome-binding protein
MDENQVKGGAGPALAAHSKDGAAPGITPASSAAGSAPHSKDTPAAGPTTTSSAAGSEDASSGSVSETMSRISGQAREAAGRVASSVSEAAGNARQSLSGQGGRAAEQAAEFVRAQPVIALVSVGVVGLALGVLLGRR